VRSVADADVGALTLVLAAAVVGFLLLVGLLQYTMSGDVGPLARDLAIGAILLAFSVGFYRRWQ
jgi:hypothetical protein